MASNVVSHNWQQVAIIVCYYIAFMSTCLPHESYARPIANNHASIISHHHPDMCIVALDDYGYHSSYHFILLGLGDCQSSKVVEFTYKGNAIRTCFFLLYVYVNELFIDKVN